MSDTKNVLITGASQGLGADMAKLFAADDFRLFINCSRSIDKAAAVADEIKDKGGEAVVVQADVSDPVAANDMLGKIDEYGGVDILVNNARVDPYKRSEDMDDAEWFDRVMGVNLKGPYICSLAAAERMKKKGWGRIVNVSSVWAYRSADRVMMEYAMSKAAMHSLTRSLAGIFGPFGITANTVAPGLIITEELENRWSAEKFESVTANIPVRRGATTAEVFDAIKMTIDNGYFNGETININGGVYMP